MGEREGVGLSTLVGKGGIFLGGVERTTHFVEKTITVFVE